MEKAQTKLKILYSSNFERVFFFCKSTFGETAFSLAYNLMVGETTQREKKKARNLFSLLAFLANF